MENDTFPIIKEDDTCPNWAAQKKPGLITMRECWYCKFSDFRKQMDEGKTYSTCRCPKNRITPLKDAH